MKKILPLAIAALLSSSLLLTGCAGLASGLDDNISVKDNLALNGSCIIAGKVIDDDTGEPIREANIVILSQPTRAVTDLYGQFEIIDMLPGKYTLQIFCVGYFQRDIPNIEAKPNRLIRLDIGLEPRSDHDE